MMASNTFGRQANQCDAGGTDKAVRACGASLKLTFEATDAARRCAVPSHAPDAANR